MEAPMEPFRLKLKVGQHEFEAEGEQESVERQFAMWRDLIASPSAQPPASAPPPAPAITTPAVDSPPLGVVADPRTEFDKIFRHEGRIVSLTIIPNGPQKMADAALLMLLGQQIYNGDDLVTGGQVLDGLKRSGISVERADRVFGEHMDQNVIRIGAHRGVKYRMTNPGVARAKELARGLVAMVP